MKRLLALILVMSMPLVCLAAGTPQWSETAGGDASPVRVETRTGTGARLVDGVWAVSNRGTADAAGSVTLDGKAVASPLEWKSTGVADGWHRVSLKADGETQTDEVLVLNSVAVQIHGGRLTADETWGNTVLHVLRNRVIIPSGKTLRITAGTNVKFCESTQIVVEAGGKLDVAGNDGAPVQFAAMANDTVGGDTDKREIAVASGTYSISVNGTATYNDYVRFLDISSVPNWYSLYLTDCVVSESTKEALVRITLSGSRGVPVTVAWRAVDGTAKYGGDFTLKEGSVSWGASESGMKYIRIPIVSDDVTEGDEKFTLELYDELSAIVTTRRCSVRIQDTGLHDEWSAGGTAPDAYVDTRRDFGGMLAHGTVAIAVRGAGAADVTPKLNGKAVGLTTDTTALEDGWHTATLAETEPLTQRIAVLNDISVMIHGGRLTADETWGSARTHLVRNNVVVPSGKTLTITEGTVVKFCTGANLVIESGGKVVVTGSAEQLVTFAHAANDSIGGDTDHEDVASVPQNGWNISNSGTLAMNQHTRVLDRTSLPGWYAFSLSDCVVAEKDGQALVRVSLSGTRSVPVSVKWRAVAGTAKWNEDYTLAEGIVSYSASESGVKTIAIPLVADDIPEGTESFSVELFEPCGAVISGSRCTVTIFDTVLPDMMANGTAADVYVDTRTTLGGQLVRGTMAFSKISDGAEGTVTLAGNGKSVKLSDSAFDSTKLPDGWYEASLGAETKQVMVLNDTSVAVHGGRMSANETWDSTKTHLVRNWVVVPNGKTLEITAGAVVKCCPGAGFVVESGGVLKVTGTAAENVVITHAGDESIGASTALDGVKAAFDSYSITQNGGTFNMNDYVQIRWRSSVSGWYAISIADCVAAERDGQALVRVSLSGSRGVPVTMQWRAVDGTATATEDYTLASGSVTWGANESGMKTITIPLVADDAVEGSESFRVEMLGATAAVLSSYTVATVTIYDQTLEDIAGTAGNSADTYVDTRRDFGGMLAQGTVHVSTTGDYDEISEPVMDGKPVQTPEKMNTAVLENGWYELSLDELGAVKTAHIAVLNDETVQVHGGRLAADETWNADKLHLVRNNVVVPSGRTLTISAGAIVKVCTGASLRTENGGAIVLTGTAEEHVVLMHVANDTLGGDTDMQEATPSANQYSIVTSGTFSANEYVEVRNVTNVSDWKTVSMENCVVAERDGVARVRVTLSGARSTPVALKWRAVDGTAAYGRDYTLNSGTLTWAANISGMKYIEIPLTVDTVEQGSRSFKVEITEVTAALVSSGSAKVTVYDVDPKMNVDFLELDTTETWELDDRPYSFQNRIVTEDVPLRYSTQWAETADGDCTARLSYVPDGGEAVVFATYTRGEGETVWSPAGLPENGYTLYHEILDSKGAVVDVQSARYNILRETLVHTGYVEKKEVWTAGQVHIVSGTVIVTGGYELTIEPGTVVKFIDGSKIWVLAGGNLVAEGVVFTHVNDDSIGGDTNQDGDATIPLYDGYSIDFVDVDKVAEKCEIRYRTFTMPTSITQNMTLQGGRTYIISANTAVTGGATLTIDAGAVLKFKGSTGFSINSGSRLVANGRYDNPVVFTSVADDEYGGDSNRDADATVPQAGSWNALTINGTAELTHAYIRYGGSGGNGLLILNGTSNVLNGRVENSSSYGIAANGAVTLANVLMAHANTGLRIIGGTTTLRNGVIDDCNYGVYAMNSGRGLVYNTIISRCAGIGTTTGWALSIWNNAMLEARFCDIWSNKEGAGALNAPAKIVQEQLTYVDPRFRDADYGDYGLRVGSPMVDAGAAEYAPQLDFAGQARENDGRVADTGMSDENGICPDLGLFELTGSAVESEIDLVVNWVRGPAMATVGDSVTVTWQTVNIGTATAVAPWTDVVGLVSAEPALGNQMVELGEVTVGDTLRPNGFKEHSATFTVPPLNEGKWRFQIAVNQFREVREGKNEENNIGTAEQQVTVLMPQLKTGESTLEIPAGASMSYRLSDVGAGGCLVLVRSGYRLVIGGGAGRISADGKSLWTAQKLQDGVYGLVIPANQTEAVTLRLENQDAEDAEAVVEIINEGFAITAGDVKEVPNRGSVTLTLMGTGLSADMEVWLQNGGRKISATRMIEGGDGVYWMTFDIEGVMAGDYDVWAKQPGTEATCSAPALKIKNGGQGAKWWCELTGSSTARTSRVSSITFTYGNSGDMELPAPYVRFYNGSGATLRFSPDEDWAEEREFLAVSGSYPYSLLKPGEQRSITVYFTIPSNVNSASILYTYTLDDDSPYPWEKNAKGMRPAWADDEAWSHILASLKSNIGETWNDYLAVLREDLDQLGALGYVGCRLDQLWQMEVNAVLGADGGISTLAQSTDLARGGRGMGIAFAREYSAQLCRRLRGGVLGLGWTHSYDYSCEMDNGQATFEISYPGGSVRTFTKTGQNWYAKQPDDKGIMSVKGALVTITEKNGSYTVYDTALERPVLGGDNEGHTVTLAWSDGKLMKVTHSDGQTLTLAYSNGLISSVSDDQGRVVRYGYENGNLVSATSFNGLVTRYHYNPYLHTANTRALVQVENPDGTTLDYEYDTWGRVVTASRNGVEQTVEVYRDGIGVFRVMDADGAEAVTYSGPYGETLLAVDAMGGATRMRYDGDTRQMLSIQTPMGSTISMQYDADQNVNRVVGAAGFATEFTHTPAYGSMSSFTDANGNSVTYAYDDKDRPTGITYQDGSKEGWTYDKTTGDALTWTNRRGQTVSYTYDGEGRLLTKSWPDGRTFAYTYNELGNVVAIVDSLMGGITVDYDDREWVTKVTYPKNRWFAFKRDAIGRVVRRTAFDGHVLNIEYDDLGRAFRWTDGDGRLYRESIFDTTVGHLVRMNNGNGTYTMYGYDMNSRVIDISHHKADGTVFASFHYRYNADGQRIALTTANGDNSYSFDADGQLISATYEDGTSDDFSYDPVGNRITANGVTYSKNSLNQYTVAGDDSFTYDADGNMASWTTAEGTITYEYDVMNRLVKVTRPDKSVWSCVYDAVGNRVSVTDRGKTRETIYLNSVYADVENGSVTKRYLGGIVESGKNVRYWHADGLISVRAMTDASGKVVGTQDYGVFGEVRNATGETTDFGFVGLGDVRLDTTGLLFMQNRYYSAELGRFIQADPIGIDAGDVSFYRYCGNDPVNGVDPSGLENVTVCAMKKPLGNLKFKAGYLSHTHIFVSDNGCLNDFGYGPTGIFTSAQDGMTSAEYLSRFDPKTQNCVEADFSDVSDLLYAASTSRVTIPSNYTVFSNGLLSLNSQARSTWDGKGSCHTFAEEFMNGLKGQYCPANW